MASHAARRRAALLAVAPVRLLPAARSGNADPARSHAFRTHSARTYHHSCSGTVLNMEKLPASTGWQWVKQGFSLFRKQPGGMSMLFLGYMFCMLAVSIVPLLGQMLPVILVPVFSIAFVQGCLNIDQGKRVLPSLLISGFRKPAFPSLLGLGVLYILMAIVAIGASTLVDDGLLWQLVTGQLTEEAARAAIPESRMGLGILLAIMLYVPAAMAFCFAAPLIYWKKTGLGKSLFFSFFAVSLHRLRRHLVRHQRRHQPVAGRHLWPHAADDAADDAAVDDTHHHHALLVLRRLPPDLRPARR